MLIIPAVFATSLEVDSVSHLLLPGRTQNMSGGLYLANHLERNSLRMFSRASKDCGQHYGDTCFLLNEKAKLVEYATTGFPR